MAEVHDQIAQPDPALVLLFASPDYDLDRLGAAIASRFQCPVIGCTTAGELSSEGYSDGSLVAASLGGGAVIAHVEDLGALDHFDPRIVAHAADRVRSRLRLVSDFDPTRLCGLLLIDGLSMREEQVAAHLHEHFPGVRFVGGSAGDGRRFRETRIYVEGAFRRDRAAFVLLETLVPFEIFRVQRLPADGPQARDHRIRSRAPPRTRDDGGPAPQEYANAVGLDAANVSAHTLSTYPLMLRIGGEYYVRSIQRVHSDGSLTFFCAIDDGLVLTVAEGVDVVNTLRDGLDDLARTIPDPALVIGFDCVLRRLEIERKGLRAPIEEILRGVPIVGFSTYGEQYNAVHINQTFVGLALGRDAT
ncbi:MAG: hypothetical protein HC882_05610 [Acidobacteria bacterium]|nr:hypothetical protein [Acidobacteriota bacterium]